MSHHFFHSLTQHSVQLFFVSRCLFVAWSNRECMDPFLQHFFTSRADQAKQQLALLHCEINRMYGMQHQAAPVTPVHVPKEQAQEGETVGDRDESSTWAPHGVAIKGSRLALFLILLCCERMVQVMAAEMSSIRREEESRGTRRGPRYLFRRKSVQVSCASHRKEKEERQWGEMEENREGKNQGNEVQQCEEG